MTRSAEEQMVDVEHRTKQLKVRRQRIVARGDIKARKRCIRLIIRLGSILSSEDVPGCDKGVWSDEGNRQRLLDVLETHATELYAQASGAGMRLPSVESAGKLRGQIHDLLREPQIQEQLGYGCQSGSQQPQR